MLRFLNNKRSCIRRLAHKAVEEGNEDRLLPSNLHRVEWKHALQEVKDDVTFPQQAAAHASQLARYGATHWGRGGKEAWKVRFVSVVFVLVHVVFIIIYVCNMHVQLTCFVNG